MHEVPVVREPVTLEYWHIGETTMRLARVSERRGSGSKRCGIQLDYVDRSEPVGRVISPAVPNAFLIKA
jgi:hypothetical protein